MKVSLKATYGTRANENFERVEPLEGKQALTLRNAVPIIENGVLIRTVLYWGFKNGDKAGEASTTLFPVTKNGVPDEYSTVTLQRFKTALKLGDIDELINDEGTGINPAYKNAQFYARVRKDYNEDGTEKQDASGRVRYKLWDVEAVGLSAGPNGQGSVMQAINF